MIQEMNPKVFLRPYDIIYINMEYISFIEIIKEWTVDDEDIVAFSFVE